MILARRLVLLTAVTLFAGCTSFSEPPPNWEGEFNAKAVLEKSFTAMGGVKSADGTPTPAADDFIATMKGLTLEGADKGEYTYVAMWKRPDKWRLDRTDAAGSTMRIVSDGVHTAQFIDGKLIGRNLPARAAGLQRLSCYLFPLKFFLEGTGTEPVLEDVKDTPDGKLIRISKVDALGNKYVLSIAASDYKPIAVRTGVPTGDDQFVIRDTVLSNFQHDARAGLVPRTLTMWAFGKELEHMEVADLRWNQNVQDAQFKTVQ